MTPESLTGNHRNHKFAAAITTPAFVPCRCSLEAYSCARAVSATLSSCHESSIAPPLMCRTSSCAALGQARIVAASRGSALTHASICAHTHVRSGTDGTFSKTSSGQSGFTLVTPASPARSRSKETNKIQATSREHCTANCIIIDHFLHLNRDWSPRFSTLRVKTAGFEPKRPEI
jgi:hypothetical protein